MYLEKKIIFFFRPMWLQVFLDDHKMALMKNPFSADLYKIPD